MNKKHMIRTIVTVIIMAILSGMIMTITFAFSSAKLNMILFKSYFQGNILMIMNFIPIFLLMGIIFLISNRLWLGYSITALIFVVMGIANKLKLTYRDDPVKFIDLKLVGESLEMSKTYDLSLSPKIIIMILGLIGIGVLLKFFFRPKIGSRKIRGGLLLSILILSGFIFKGYYFDQAIYAATGDVTVINRWVESQRYQSKGLVYPFIYSIQESIEKPPEGYDPEKAREDLNQYEYKDIPGEKKVNVIGIMLEAYNDFSEFEGVDLGIDPYVNFHKLQEESIHGKLVTNVFGGDTINTERGFITGYHNHPKYFNQTNSFIWYFKEQGYRTEAMHPITGSFYNRRNVNEYLGFDKYDHFDNRYGQVQDSPLMDMEFFDFIIEGYENSKKDKEPYLNFSVTYQNHGPYSDEEYSKNQFLKKKDTYDDGTYNIVNNYLAGISETDVALEKLFNYFRNEDEPTVIVIFGDHNPWLGQGNSGYEMLDIDLDLSQEEGFKNYYETPYLIWGNEEAKSTLDRDFRGEGPAISPNSLMAELFDYVGWEGNEYMQYIIDMKNRFPVNHKLYFEEDGELKEELSEENKEVWNKFINLEYYQSQNFKK